MYVVKSPVLPQSEAIRRRSHERDVPVLVLVERDAHDALELGRERVQNAREGPIEVVLAIVQRFAAEKIANNITLFIIIGNISCQNGH